MKKLLLMLFILFIFSQSYSYDKFPLVERFTNASCVPCATINNSWYNVTTRGLVESRSIAHVIYNGWWPGSNDPMYLLNQTDNTTRINYYGVNAVPRIVVGGSTISTSQSALVNAVNSVSSEYSPFRILVVQEELTTSLIKYVVKVTRDPNDNSAFGNVKLRFAITERTVAFASPPGSNGESKFYSVCRKMLPDANGTVLQIPAPGETTEITLEYIPTSQFISSVNFDSIKAVTFIQSDDDKYIYQAFVAEHYNSEIIETSPDVMSDNNTPASFTATVLNNGLFDDSYLVEVSLDASNGWTGEFTTSNGTFPFTQTDIINVAAGSSAGVSLTVNPNGIDGFGITTVQFTSQSEENLISSSVFRNITSSGIDLLVVDASGEGYGDAVFNSVNNVYGGTYGIISKEALQNPNDDLNNFQIVMWSAGNSVPVFTIDEVNALQNYLDQNGLLFINGQDIGADIFETSGQSQHAQSFYNNYLHANYVANFGGSYFITGLDNDPIGDGLVFPIDPSLYSRSPDQIAPADADASPVLRFGTTTNYLGLKAEGENYRIVYFAIGLEQIADAAVRDTVVSRIIGWLEDGILVGVDDMNPADVKSYSLKQNYPNPFNPSTKISYSITEDSYVSLKIYDIMGAEVAELVDQKQSPGNYEIQFDASRLSSGMYFYKLSAGDYTSIKKMTLLK